MATGKRTYGAHLRLVVAPDIAIGPGKADLLEGVKETGSISAAGRRIGMSYKRAWFLISAMNGHFDTPLVETAKGGRSGGGARLTPLGEDVLAAYREAEARCGTAIAPVLKKLARRVAKSGRS